LKGEVRSKLKWADGKQMKSEIDVQIFDLLGEKTEEDLNPTKQASTPKASAENKKSDKPKQATNEEKTVTFADMKFHKPGENYKSEEYVITDKTMDLMAKHLKETGGKGNFLCFFLRYDLTILI
jgi:glutaminyl-tRNA synthetase